MSSTGFPGSWDVVIFVPGVLNRIILLPITCVQPCVDHVEGLAAYGKTTALCAGNANGCLKIGNATIDIERNRSMAAAKPCVK